MHSTKLLTVIKGKDLSKSEMPCMGFQTITRSLEAYNISGALDHPPHLPEDFKTNISQEKQEDMEDWVRTIWASPRNNGRESYIHSIGWN